ncbi:MAG: Asp-tRNA(Asn)/Glu-tRNA(Gln) amidotransferase subunit GatC [Myxococcales bacterium]|nr:Asp-tRNA(Asn)/Glu-tRNA(Gln) amidotransferase subunit GatC [Myxococcales bacterium]
MRASLLAMSRIDADMIQYIAKLARLSLDTDEVAQMTADLDRVLEYVATLEELDTDGITPTAHAIALETPLRNDEAVGGMDPELAVSNAPVAAGTAFSVPKVLDGEAV